MANTKLDTKVCRACSEEIWTALSEIAKNDTYSFMRSLFEQMLEDTINNIYHKLYHTGSTNVSYYSSFYSAGIMRLYFDYLKENIKISLDEVTTISTRACFLSLDDILNRKH